MIGNLAIFWPAIVQAFLTLGVYLLLLVRRLATLRDRQAMATWRSGGAEPEPSAVVARNIANQFELPVLFYAVCIALYVTNGASWFAVALAWIFAASRIIHAAVHLGSNAVFQRLGVFLVGFTALFVLWIVFALHLLGVA